VQQPCLTDVANHADAQREGVCWQRGETQLLRPAVILIACRGEPRLEGDEWADQTLAAQAGGRSAVQCRGHVVHHPGQESGPHMNRQQRTGAKAGTGQPGSDRQERHVAEQAAGCPGLAMLPVVAAALCLPCARSIAALSLQHLAVRASLLPFSTPFGCALHAGVGTHATQRHTRHTSTSSRSSCLWLAALQALHAPTR